MIILREDKVIIMHIKYDNTAASEDKDSVYKYLDDRFGVHKYRVTRSGPMIDNVGMGLIIAECEV